MTDTIKNRAIALFQKGAFEKSDELYKEIIDQSPDDSGAWHMRGYIAVQLRQFEKAVDYISRAIELKPKVYTMHVNLGSALARLKRFDQAIVAQKKAIEIKPTGADAYFGLANSLKANQQPDEADAAYAEAIRLNPDWTDALEAASFNAAQMGHGDKALDYALRALAQEPDRLLSNKIAGNIYLSRREYDLALSHYKAALKTDPNDSAANGNLGLLLIRTGEYEASIKAYKKAVAEDPEDPIVRHGLSLALLALGRLSEGWEHFRARLDRPGHLLSDRPMSAPRICERPKNLNVMTWADEGIGDQIMLASMIPEIEADAASLSVECDARLAPLFKRSFPSVEIIPRETPPHPKFNASYDGQFCLGDAAKWYRPNFETFPRQPGYLVANSKLAHELRRSYQSTTHPKPLIGISWRTKEEIKLSLEKSLELNKWGPILSVPGATFVNLQYGDHQTELAEAEKSIGTSIISDPRIDPLKNLDSFASQVAAMDLVITISNATAHMAGALNVPTWTLIPNGFGAMWHWFLDRDDSPWYPSIKLLRQTERGNWTSVVDQASSLLTDFVTQWRPSDAR